MNSINPMQMFQAFQLFRKQFSGNPKQAVMQLVQSGRMSQSQLNQLQNMASIFQRMLSGMN